MCGICGVKGGILSERKRFVNMMLQTLSHRGPDEDGMYSDEVISLGMKRLSIIDLSTGIQPIYNEDKTIAIVCNGEIYNFQIQRENLAGQGHIFYTHSDAEVLVHLYEEYKTECLRFIKGMFSFALWDRNEKVLFIARDRFGIKPLYYYYKNGIFAFSSELKALLQLPFLTRELNVESLHLYFSLEYVPSPHSILRGIYKLRPAHYLLSKSSGIEVCRYWNLEKTDIGTNISIYEAQVRLRDCLCTSIREHLVSDVPLGIFLSGGLDSSTLVALAKEVSQKNLSTFSIGFEESSFDESQYALLAAKHFKTEHYNYVFSLESFLRTFPTVVDLLDEPLADLSIFPTYELSRLSRRHIKVALSGEGGDELFMGYPTYIAHRYAPLFCYFPPTVKRIIKNLTERLPTSFSYFSLDFKLKRFISGIWEGQPVIRHLLWMAPFSDIEKDMLFRKGIVESELKDKDGSIKNFIDELEVDFDMKEIYKIIQYVDIFTYLSDDLLVKTDRASMFSSLEVRVPYLDHKLVEFIWGLNHKLIYQKKILKKMMEGLMPKRILFRPKQGFPIPFSKWVSDKKFFEMIEEFFNKGFIERQNLFNYNYIDFLFNEHLSGKKDNGKKLGAYIMFQCWHKRWFSRCTHYV